jgi:two-component system, OmpR family, response regulator
MRVLIVEDELRMASLIRRGLFQEGLAVDVTGSGEDALWMAQASDYDAIVLDVMLPGINGFETCRRLRTSGVWSPVLMLTARDSVEDRVAGLDTGADDYLVKPFAFAELLARLRAIARRGEHERPSVLEAGDLRLDPATRRVWRDSTEIQLSTKEFAMLETFMRRPDEVLSRLHLLEHAWDFAYENRSNVVDVYIRHLRAKIDEPFGRHSLETIRGAGYRLRADGGLDGAVVVDGAASDSAA